MENKCGRQVWETSGKQVGDKCRLMRSKTSKVGDTCGKQVGDKCKIMRPKTPKVKGKCGRQWKTSVVNSCGPRNPECEGQVGDKCKIMRPKVPRVKDKCGKQVEDKYKIMGYVRDKWETSLKSCGHRHPKWETSVENKYGTVENNLGDNCRLMQPKEPEWETSGRQM